MPSCTKFTILNTKRTIKLWFTFCSHVKTFISLQSWVLSFSATQVAASPASPSLWCKWTHKVPRTMFLSKNITLSCPIMAPIILPKKSSHALTICHPTSEMMNVLDFGPTHFADSAGSSVHPFLVLNLLTTLMYLLKALPKNSKVGLWNSLLALSQCTAAHCSFELHWHVNTECDQGNQDLAAFVDSRVAACWCTCTALWLVFVASDLWAWNVNISYPI